MAEIGKTKQALANALKTQLKTESFASISVARICEPCGISRKSFYYHFCDKYDLVNWIFRTEWLDLHTAPLTQEISSLCEYLYENRGFYRKVLCVNGQNSFGEYLHERCTATVDRVEEFASVFYADAFLCAICRWLCERPTQSPAVFAQKLSECMRKR